VRRRTVAGARAGCQRSSAVSASELTPHALVCDRCGDIIGIYEPTVVVDGEPRETSRAAEPDLAARPGERYHRACFAAR